MVFPGFSGNMIKLGLKIALKILVQFANQLYFWEDNFMNSHNAKRIRPRVLILGAVVIALAMLHPGTLAAKTDACALLKAADVAPLLGGTPTNTTTPEKMTCTWTGSSAKHKLIIFTYKEMVPGSVMFMGARQGAQAQANEGAKVNDETGIGDKAFSTQVSFGVVFMVLKQGRVLQLQYWTGTQGTAQDVDALRPVVKKAVAAF